MKIQTISLQQACAPQPCVALAASEGCCRYPVRISDENAPIADSLVPAAQNRSNWALGLYLVLRNIKGHRCNHKRGYRIHCELVRNVRINHRKRSSSKKPQPLAVLKASNDSWSMDFMHDQLSDGHGFRLSNLLDDFIRERMGSAVAFLLPAERVGRPLAQTTIIAPSDRNGRLVVTLDVLALLRPPNSGSLQRARLL